MKLYVSYKINKTASICVFECIELGLKVYKVYYNKNILGVHLSRDVANTRALYLTRSVKEVSKCD